MIKKILLSILLIFFIIPSSIADEVVVDGSNIVENTYPKNSLEYKVAKLNSNAYRRTFLKIDNVTNDSINLVSNEVVESAKVVAETTGEVASSTVDLASKNSATAVDSLEMQEGESLTDNQKKRLRTTAFQRAMNNSLDIEALKYKYFNGFKMSETLSHAMLNVQQDTGDPLFMLEARQQGILEDNYIYFGGKGAVLDWRDLSPVPNGATAKDFSYFLDGYVASTISPWITTLLGFSLYSSDDKKLNIDPNTIYLIVGNLSESPYFGYAAISTVMFGNFDIVSNYVPTVTRQYFMQSGGNVNVSYHTDTLHLNAVLLASNSLNYLGVTNSGSKSGIGFSLNAKYVYEMESVGDYHFLGAAYTDATGFQTKSGDRVGAFDINYGLSYSKLNFEAEALITDKGVSGLNSSSALSPGNVAGAPFFGSIKPSSALLYDNYMGSGGVVATWATNFSYTADVFDHSLIPYVDYSQILQDSKNYSYNFGAGFRYVLFQGSWVGLDASNLTTRSPNILESQNYLSLNYTVYV